MKPVTAQPRRSVASRAARQDRARFPAPSGDTTYDLTLLEQSFEKWQRSPALQTVYGSIYREMATLAAPGPALELGSGCGTIRQFVPGVITSDIRRTPYVDCVASAYDLESVDGAPWSTIYLLDVLHHLRDPFRFFASAARSLRPGGRIVICDPAATMGGRVFYRLFHHEPTRPERIIAPYVMPPDDASGAFANMGLTWALFVRDAAGVTERLKSMDLAVHSIRFRDVLAYPATGGYSGRSWLSASWLRWLLRFEQRISQRLLRHFALRMCVVLERNT